jgi:hypothetical protein
MNKVTTEFELENGRVARITAPKDLTPAEAEVVGKRFKAFIKGFAKGK